MFLNQSFTDGFSIFQNKLFKAKRAKLKKSILDSIATAGILGYENFVYCLKQNKIKVINLKLTKQFFIAFGNRVSVDNVMNYLEFMNADGNQEITAKIKLPEKVLAFLYAKENAGEREETITPYPPKRTETNESFVPRPPENKPNNVRQFKRVLDTSTQEDEKYRLKYEEYNNNTEPKVHFTEDKRGRRHQTLNADEISRDLDGLSHRSYDEYNNKYTKTTDQDDYQYKYFNRANSSKRLVPEEPLPNPSFKRKLIEYRAKPITKGAGTYEERVLELVHDLQYALVEYKYVFDMLKSLMSILGDNHGSIPKAVFDRENALLKKNIGSELFDRIIELSLNEDGRVDVQRLGKIVDMFKYSPDLTKKFKNSSEQFQKLALFGGAGHDKSQTYKNYHLLAQKIEEKFELMRKAYRFFDTDKTGKISLSNFKHGLDLLSMRLPDNEVRNLFIFLDRKQDGILDYDEFCDILEDRKIVKGTEFEMYDIDGKLKPVKPGHYDKGNPHISYMTPDVRDSVKFTDYLKHHGNAGEVISEVHEKVASSNYLLQKVPVGSSKKFGYVMPSVIDESYRFGNKSMPTEQMSDIMSHNYQREWIDKLKDSERRKKQKEHEEKKEKKFETQASVMRNEFVKRILEKKNGTLNSTQGSWKMSRFSQVGPRINSRPVSTAGSRKTTERLNQSVNEGERFIPPSKRNMMNNSFL